MSSWGDKTSRYLTGTPSKKRRDFVVIFLGKEAVASEWVKRELLWALESEKNIGRVLVLPVPPDDVWDMVKPAGFWNIW
jgi:hypothetical protein